MINQGQMHPIYEAMSVCSGTLQWLNQQEQERSDWDLCTNLTKVGSVMQEFVDASKKVSGDTEGASSNMRSFAIFCLRTVTSMTRLINRSVRDGLLDRSERLRPQIEFLLDQVDDLTERVEDITEAWEMSLDQGLATKLDAAVQQIDSSKADIPAWRDALELISN